LRILGHKREKCGEKYIMRSFMTCLYFSLNAIVLIKSRYLIMGWTCNTHGEMRNVHKVSGGKSDGRRPLQKLRHRYKDNIKMDLPEIGCEDADWINWTQNSI
jgi:hypothetical protein